MELVLRQAEALGERLGRSLPQPSGLGRSNRRKSARLIEFKFNVFDQLVRRDLQCGRDFQDG